MEFLRCMFQNNFITEFLYVQENNYRIVQFSYFYLVPYLDKNNIISFVYLKFVCFFLRVLKVIEQDFRCR